MVSLPHGTILLSVIQSINQPINKSFWLKSFLFMYTHLLYTFSEITNLLKIKKARKN